jgi:hypothetical protein
MADETASNSNAEAGRSTIASDGSIEGSARKAWIAEGPAMVERVALGFITEANEEFGLKEAITWYELPNVADPDVAVEEGRGEFFVDGEAIQRVLTVAQLEGHEAETRVLWHTHVNTPEPSAEDIAEFPDWLAHIGMVYHVPSDKVTLYNQSGIISSVMDPSEGAIATDQEL